MNHLRYNLSLFVCMLALAASVSAQTKDFQIKPSDKYHRFTVAGTGTIPIYNLTNHKLYLHYHDQVQSNIVVRTGTGFDLDTSRMYSVFDLEIGYGYSTTFHRDEIVIYDSTGSDTIIVEGADTSASNMYLPFNTQNESLLTFQHNRAEAFGWINFESGSSDIEIATLTLTQSGSAFWLDSNYIAIPAQTDVYHPGWTGTRVHYHRTGNPYDTAYLTIGSPHSSAHHTFLVSAIATPDISEIDVSSQSVGFGVVHPNDSICKDFVITNPSYQTIVIDSFVTDTSWIRYYRDDFTVAATLPVTLHDHDSVRFTACLTPGTTRDTQEGRRIYVHYTDSLGLHGIATVDLSARIAQCVSLTPDSLQFGSTIAGGVVTKTITVSNNTRDQVTVGDSVLAFGTTTLVFPDGDPFPLTLDSGESRTFNVSLSDTASGWQHVQLLLYPRDSSGNLLCASTNELILHVLDNGDTSALSIFGGEQEVLPILSDRNNITKVFTFVNDASDSIKIISATLAGSSGHFTITDIAPALPATLASFARLAVTIEFEADTNGLYRDTLIVLTENALVAYRIPVVGSRLKGISAGITENTLDRELMVYPNPASDRVNVELPGASISSIELLDILGNSLHVVRNGSELTLAGVPHGHYIVRIQATSGSGERRTFSRMIEVN
jgi:hypothetical protein